MERASSVRPFCEGRPEERQYPRYDRARKVYAGDDGGEDEVRRVRIEEREGRRGGEDEPFL